MHTAPQMMVQASDRQVLIKTTAGVVPRCVAVLVALLITQGAVGQDDFWQHTGGPNGSEGRAVELSPEGELYVGTFGEGVYRSHDRGDTWGYFGLDHVHGVYDFAFSPEFVFAATWNGVYRTSREHPEWELLASGAAFSIGITTEGILLAGFTGGVVSRSNDEGVTWTDISEGLDDVSIEPDALEGDDQGRVLLGTNRGLFVMKGGLPWRRISADSLRVSSIALMGDDILIGTSGQTTRGVLRTRDGGANWIKINGDIEQPLHVSALVSYDEKGIVAGTSSGVYISIDGGLSWTSTNEGMHESHVYDVAADPEGVVYAGMIIGAGIYRSSDPEGPWEHVGLPSTNVVSLAFGHQGNVYAAPTNGSVSALEDDTGKWDVLRQYEIGSLIVGPDEQLLASGLLWPTSHYLLEDNSSIWRRVAAASECSSTRSFHLTMSGRLYAAAHPQYPPVGKGVGITFADVTCGGVFVSDDFSLNWTHLGLEDEYVFDVLETSEEKVLAAAEYGIYFFDDDGEEWLMADVPLDGRLSTSLVEGDEGMVFAGTSDGVLISRDGGDSWQRTSLENVFVSDIVASMAGDLFAATDDGVYRSSNDGRSWTSLDSGLAEGAVLELGFNTGGFLFASVQNRGVYRSIEPVVLSIPEQGPLPSEMSLEAYPNPSAGDVVLSFSLPKPQTVHVEVFDIVGRRVATLIDGRSMPPGAHRIVWDSDVHASGVYFFRLFGPDAARTGSVLLAK